MLIRDKIAVVTGAASGIGNAVSQRLVAAGAKRVGMVDLIDSVQSASDQINQAEGKKVTQAFQGDVTDSEFRAQVFQTLGESAPVQICVPAAGILRDAMAVKLNKSTGEAELYDQDQFRQVLEVNLMHPVYWTMQMIAGVAEYRAKAGAGKWSAEEELQGCSVMVGSVSSRGNRGQVSYSSAKSGLNAAAKTLNVEGSFYGIQTKIIHPGFVQTPMVEQLPDGLFEEHLRQLVPIDRLIQPQEIANTVAAMIENPIISGPVWADGGLPPMT